MDQKTFAEYCQAIVDYLGAENERELLKDQVGGLIPSNETGIVFSDNTIRITKSLESKAFCITKKENDNPVFWRTQDGSIGRTNGEWFHLTAHVEQLMRENEKLLPERDRWNELY